MVSNQNFRKIKLDGKLINVFNEDYLFENDIDTSNPNSIFNVAVGDPEKVYGKFNDKLNLKEGNINRNSLIEFISDIIYENKCAFDGEYINLPLRDLERLIAPHANFNRANLREANLKGAYLKQSYLNGANLNRACLSATYLERAHLERAYLEWSYLNGANLNEADLNCADLKGADLEWANLKGTKLNGANLREAHLYGANLSLANLINVKGLTKEQLSEARYKQGSPPKTYPLSPNRNLIKYMQTSN